MLDWSDGPYWLAFGLVGNLTFASRFVIQWLASELAGESVVPKMFWFLSIAGSLILLTSAIHLRNPVFVIAFLPNCLIYVRNLVLIRNKEESESHPRG